MSGSLLILSPGPLTTVQDAGRPGLAAVGVGRSGACDRASYELANRLVGNRPGAAALEVTFGGLWLQARSDVVVVTTGAPCPGSAVHNAPAVLHAGDQMRLGVPTCGLRTYVGVRGGLGVQPVLGSRCTDLLGGIGPPVLASGAILTLADEAGQLPGVDVAAVADPTEGTLGVAVVPGPRQDWFSAPTHELLTAATFTVTSESNRVGLRLHGPRLGPARAGELASEGLVRGAIQVPPAGDPVLMLADHPVTGGYPVLAYVVDGDVDRCAQLRPGQGVRFRATRGWPRFDHPSGNT